MSRVKKFSRNLATGHLRLGVNAAYSLISVPLVPHGLPRAEYGMWALLTRLMGYIALDDLGVNQAICAFQADGKQFNSTNHKQCALLSSSAP